ncbi:ADP-ribose pyrophosphatase YjhB (NUDIX family) [Motilibacter peucedani]|uniref:ADP-ribose pyrophosphatase YjhB (NUDIX family) n=1 Tax=Motilibacter peucedani TaxID=598650 RepID=A0A420XPQ3_9ACTN|nr:NUDIX domain-containing protein [Motilibacter peucedani]RKS75240.1 ADP-ribose pyrophosphatase YjhB (NUDIX family) [Motilibacter peucedani]
MSADSATCADRPEGAAYALVPAAYVVLRRGDGPGEVLLQLRQGTGYLDGHWACGAAGHVEAGESVVQAAVREAREELGVELSPDSLRPLCGMHRSGGTGLAVDERADFFFEAREWAGEPALQEADRAADLRWYALDALPEPVVPHERLVLEHLLRGTLPAVLAVGFEPADARPVVHSAPVADHPVGGSA